MVPVVTLPFVEVNIAFGQKVSKLSEDSSQLDLLPPCFSGFSSASEANETVMLLLQPIIDYVQCVVSEVFLKEASETHGCSCYPKLLLACRIHGTVVARDHIVYLGLVWACLGLCYLYRIWVALKCMQPF